MKLRREVITRMSGTQDNGYTKSGDLAFVALVAVMSAMLGWCGLSVAVALDTADRQHEQPRLSPGCIAIDALRDACYLEDSRAARDPMRMRRR